VRVNQARTRTASVAAAILAAVTLADTALDAPPFEEIAYKSERSPEPASCDPKKWRCSKKYRSLARN
jgi:hypothetical protein